jgi:translation initiation factor 3 subunit E
MLKELIKVIQQEQHTYKDPITEFLECLYVNYDFDGAQQKLMECEQVTLRLFSSNFQGLKFVFHVCAS